MSVQPKPRPFLICANPRCGKEFQPKRLGKPNRYCSHACNASAQMSALHQQKAMAPGPSKPLPELTEAERQELEDRLRQIRDELQVKGLPLVDLGWRERRATSRAEVA